MMTTVLVQHIASACLFAWCPALQSRSHGVGWLQVLHQPSFKRLAVALVPSSTEKHGVASAMLSVRAGGQFSSRWPEIEFNSVGRFQRLSGNLAQRPSTATRAPLASQAGSPDSEQPGEPAVASSRPRNRPCDALGARHAIADDAAKHVKRGWRKKNR